MELDYIKSIRKLLGYTEITVPGGSADPGEGIIKSIERETFEETGLTLISPIAFGFSSSPTLERITFPNGDKLHSFNLLFFTRQYTGELTLSEESTRLEWFEFTRLPPMLENMEATVMAYLQYAETGEFQIVAEEVSY